MTQPENAHAATILVVEDNPEIRELSVTALAGRQWRILEAANAEEALALLSDHIGPVDLLLIDLTLPGMDGQTLATHARSSKPETKVLFTSGHSSSVVRDQPRDGCVSFLQKPYSLRTLRERVVEMLALPG